MSGPLLIRHEGVAPRERSSCGWRDRLISREDAGTGVAAWTRAVDIDAARSHFHLRSTEIYYVLDGEGAVLLDGVEHPVRKGSLVHIPPGVVHGTVARMRVLVLGVPDIAEDDLFYREETHPSTGRIPRPMSWQRNPLRGTAARLKPGAR